MNAQDLFSSFVNGNLHLQLESLELSHGKRFVGKGALGWGKNGLLLSASTNGGHQLEDKLGVMPFPVGKLLEDSDYLVLRGRTSCGLDVLNERVINEGSNHAWGKDEVKWDMQLNQGTTTIGSLAIHSSKVLLVFSNFDYGPLPHRMNYEGYHREAIQIVSSLGLLTAINLGDGVLQVELTKSQDCKLPDSVIAETIGLSLCIWTGKMLPLRGYLASSESDGFYLKTFPNDNRRTQLVAPPLGYGHSLDLIEQHIPLLTCMMNYFANPANHKYGNAILSYLNCIPVPFSADYLISCSVLERIATLMMSNKRPEVMSKQQKDLLLATATQAGFSETLYKRIKGFLDKINSMNGASQLNVWCQTNYLGFNEEDAAAWLSRNTVAHGNFSLFSGTYENRRTQVKQRDRIRNMINKLIMQLMGYEGTRLFQIYYQPCKFMNRVGHHSLPDCIDDPSWIDNRRGS